MPEQTNPPFPQEDRLVVILAVLIIGACAILPPAQAEGSSTNDAWIASERASRKPNPIPADEKSIAKGKEFYVMGCAPCHGPLGKGDGPAGSTLERNGVKIHPGNLSDPKMWEQTDGGIFWKLTEGRTPMPAWGETLSEEQRWTVINYIRTLAPKPESGVGNTKPVATTNNITTPKPEGKP